MRKRDFVWLARMRLLDHVIASGVDVLMSDIDAHWLRSPLSRIRAELARGADVVASRSADWPIDLAQKWGSVLCMGFAYFRSNVRTRELLDTMAAEMSAAARPDDQVALNTALDEMGLQLSGATTPQRGLPSKKTALITSDYGIMRSLSIKWPNHPGLFALQSARTTRTLRSGEHRPG